MTRKGIYEKFDFYLCKSPEIYYLRKVLLMGNNYV